MERAINNAHRIVNSNHTRAIHASEGNSHRTRLGIERDTAGWITLLSTVNLTATNDNHWFQCFVNLERLEQIASYLSLSRGSRFLSLYKKTDFLKVRYKQSKKDKSIKYCEVFISKKAFFEAGVLPEDLEKEIKRKEKNDLKRLQTVGTQEYEAAYAKTKQLQRKLYLVQKDEKIRRAKAKQQYQIEQSKKRKNESLKKEAYERLIKLQKEYPGKSVKELESLLMKHYPAYRHILGPAPPGDE